MSSIVEIYNFALASVGSQQDVSAADEMSTEAVKCTLFYANCRDRVLRDFDWPFARQYYTLGLVADAPNTEWAYAYRYPTTALNVRAIVNATRSSVPRIPFSLGSDASGKLIYTDAENAVARMTVRIEDPELFDPLFVSALSFLLGSRVGPALSRDAKLTALAYQMYGADVASARVEAANEGGQDPAPDAESITARA
jgi:hypothetical protein